MMSFARFYRIVALLLALFALGSSRAQDNERALGTVKFPTSGSAEAQAHFLRGVAALHSFWYPVALREFRAATNIDPDFMMGYWGEAMAHNHPIWGDPQETDAARAVLKKVRITPALSARERAYLDAVRILYGAAEKAERDRAYARAMAAIHEAYPQDLEAASFYALALLASADPSDADGLKTRMQAAAIALDVYNREPNHPGAAHYILHAFDDPAHAVLALPAARRYAQIAPAAPHALHMPSHIFLQLGMWDEVARSNEAAWAASVRWVRENDLPVSQRDYHSLHWLLYAYLQQGRQREAAELLDIMSKSFAQFPQDDPRNLAFGAYTLAGMAAHLVVESERWNDNGEILPAEPPPKDPLGDAPGNPYQPYLALTATPTVFARGLSAAMSGSADARRHAQRLRAVASQIKGKSLEFAPNMDSVLEIQALEIEGALAATRGNIDRAIATLKRAAALEAALPAPSGPPPVIKPAHELLGRVLLQAGRPGAALEQYRTSLTRHPERARALIGVARAAAASGDREAADAAHARLGQRWRHAAAAATARHKRIVDSGRLS